MKQLNTARNSTAPGAIVAALAYWLLASIAPACAADVSYERLLNPEPQNWLMHHRDFNAQRYSPLQVINKSNAKNLKLQFAVALGGKSAADSLEATPLVEDGFMYIVDSWGVVYKIDVRSGTVGTIIWKMDPGLANQDRNRGAALWGNLVISVTGYAGRVIATDKESGKIVWDKNLLDQADLELTAAPLALKDSIVVGGSGGDRGLRNWVAALDPKTGETKWKTYSIPAPGEPGSETWKDSHNSWQTGGGAFFGTGAYDPSTNLTYWGSGNPVPAYDSSYRPGDNLYTNSAIAFDVASGRITWHFQYTPNDNHDYDEIGSHILIDTKVNGEDRKVIAHPARNGFSYVLDRLNGQFLKATQTVKDLTWTKGIDQKTGRPIDYDPSRDVQVYAEGAESVADKNTHRICPSVTGGTNFWPSSYSRETGYLYIPAAEGCGQVTVDTSAHNKGKFGGGAGSGNERITSSFTILDPGSGEIKKRVELPYPNSSGVLSTAGGIVVTALLDGSVIAFDDETLDVLWRINLGSGFNAPPMTYSVNGKQYIAVASGPCCVRPSGQNANSRSRIARTPELRDMSQATVLYVFGL
jgi:alcohol dehydrogenase (cytochrome c)